MNLDTSFSCCLMSVDFEYICLKHLLIFEPCHYFILVFAISGAVSVKAGRKKFYVGYKLMSVTV